MIEITEMKTMLDEMIKELESLRAENQELKLRLARYENESSSFVSTDDIKLEVVKQEMCSNAHFRPIYRVGAGFNRLIDEGYVSLGDCRGLTMYDVINLPQVGIDSAAIVVVALEHYGIIDANNFCISKVKKSDSKYKHFMDRVAYFKKVFGNWSE